MGLFEKDKWVNFVIENYRNLEDVIEVYEAAKKKLPEQVNKAVHNAIFGLEKSFFEDNNLSCDGDKDAIYWFHPSAYSEDKETGFFFEYDNIGWYELVANTKTEAGWIYAYYIPDGKNKAIRTENTNKWKAEFDKHRASLEKSQIVVGPDKDDRQVLAAHYLDKEVNIEILKTEGALETQIQKAVKDFTAAILPIMRTMISK